MKRSPSRRRRAGPSARACCGSAGSRAWSCSATRPAARRRRHWDEDWTGRLRTLLAEAAAQGLAADEVIRHCEDALAGFVSPAAAEAHGRGPDESSRCCSRSAGQPRQRQRWRSFRDGAGGRLRCGEPVLCLGVDVRWQWPARGHLHVGAQVLRVLLVPTIALDTPGWLSVKRRMNSWRLMPSPSSSSSLAASQRFRAGGRRS